jgi:PKD repeat protein
MMQIVSFGQNWSRNLHANKKDNNPITFFEIQKAFNDYWEEYDVKNGYYIDSKGNKKKAAGWKQFKRWEWYMESQINPKTGEFPTNTAQQVYDRFYINNLKSSQLSTDNWKSIGPNISDGGYAGIGRVNCIAFHPTDNNTYWIGTPAGGLWETTNNGNSWKCLTDNNNVLGISDIVIPSDYSTSSIIYIGTGDKDGWDNRSIGVLKSTNGGVSWNNTGLSFSIQSGNMVNRLLLDPNDDNTIVAATSKGVYKTVDGGDNWTQLTSRNYIDLEYKPSDFNVLYGGTKDGGVYKSTDGGNNWFKILSEQDGYRVDIAVTPDNPNLIYVVIVNDADGLLNIHKSSNSGTNFTEILKGSEKNLLGWEYDGSDKEGQGWYDLTIAVSPINSDIVLVGGVNTWRSTNAGNSWNIINHWSGDDGNLTIHADKHSLTFRENGDLFECNDGGIYYSNDNGTNFADKTNGIVISQMYKLGNSKTEQNEIITGLQDNGTKLLSNKIWKDVSDGDGTECIIDYNDINVQYSSYVNGEITRTKNHWASSVNIQSEDAGAGAWVTPVLMDPINSNTLYAGYADVWKTIDKGNTWTKISSINTSDKLRAMAISMSNTNRLIVSNTKHIWQTSDGGKNWTEITNDLPVIYSNITSITISKDNSKVWVTLSGYNDDCVYQTTNSGQTWENISDGLPQIPVYSIVQDTQIENYTYIYAGTELGVYLKKNESEWIRYNNGLPNVKIGELEIYYNTIRDSSKLRAATFGRGLWESQLFTQSTQKPVADFYVESPLNCIGNSIEFHNISQNIPTEYQWSFEGGTPATSTEQNPVVSYNNLGTYTVTLVAINTAGKDTLVRTNYIVIGEKTAPIVGFTADTITYMNEYVQFRDTSLKCPESWQWSFEGGTPTTSTEQNPKIKYEKAGVYNVSLKVTNELGDSSITKNKYITVHLPIPMVNFDATPKSGVDPLTVSFTDKSSYAQSWLWDFGDGEQSTEEKPTHTFAKGLYTVKLVVSNSTGKDSLIIDNMINVDANSLSENMKYKLKIYPNPTSNYITIELANDNFKDVIIELYDINGRLVKKVTPVIETLIKQKIDISSFKSGSYILKIRIDNNIQILQIIKE